MRMDEGGRVKEHLSTTPCTTVCLGRWWAVSMKRKMDTLLKLNTLRVCVCVRVIPAHCSLTTLQQEKLHQFLCNTAQQRSGHHRRIAAGR